MKKITGLFAVVIAVFALQSLFAAALEEPVAPADKINAPEKTRLVITEVLIKPSTEVAIVGQPMKVYYKVRNMGATFDGLIRYELLVDGKVVRARDTKESINTGREMDYSFEGVIMEIPGEHKFVIVLSYNAGNGTETIISEPKAIDVKETDFGKDNSPIGTSGLPVNNPAPGGLLPAEPKDKIAIKAGNEWSDITPYILLIVIVILAISLVGFAYLTRTKKPTPIKIGIGMEPNLEELQRKREELEEIIKITKVKYFKRKLDEDSYKEIIKDNQEKLIEIEAKIEQIEGRVKKLEDLENQKRY